jgi:MFS family permease
MPGYTAAATLEVDPHEQGTVAGIMTAAQGYGAMAGPLVATSLYQIQPALPYLLTCVLLSLVAIAAWVSPRLRRIVVTAQPATATD